MACLGMVKISVIIRYNFLLLNKLLSPTYEVSNIEILLSTQDYQIF